MSALLVLVNVTKSPANNRKELKSGKIVLNALSCLFVGIASGVNIYICVCIVFSVCTIRSIMYVLYMNAEAHRKEILSEFSTLECAGAPRQIFL